MTPVKQHRTPFAQSIAEREKRAREQATAAAIRLASDFAAVFGQPRKRSDAQRRVLEHLAVCAGGEDNSYQFHTAKDGLAIIASGVHRDGAKSLLRVIDLQLRNATKRTE